MCNMNFLILYISSFIPWYFKTLFTFKRYLEDLSTLYHPETKSWMKTLQGLALLIQCFGGEVPSFILSSNWQHLIGHGFTTLTCEWFHPYRLYTETYGPHARVFSDVFHVHVDIFRVLGHQRPSVGSASRGAERHCVRTGVLGSHFVRSSCDSPWCRRYTAGIRRDSFKRNRYT